MPDILGGLGELDISRQAPPPQQQPQLFDDPFGGPSPQQPPQGQAQKLPVLLSADKGKGLTLLGRLIQEGGQTGTLLVLTTFIFQLVLTTLIFEETSNVQRALVDRQELSHQHKRMYASLLNDQAAVSCTSTAFISD